jgi:hypothetical protein
MAQLVNAAKQAKGTIGSGVGQALDKVVTDLEEAMVIAEHRTGRAMRDLVDSAESVKGRRRGAAVAATRRRPPSTPAQ